MYPFTYVPTVKKIAKIVSIIRCKVLPIAILLLSMAPPNGVASTLTRADRLSPMAAGYLERAKTMVSDGNFAGAIDQLKHLETQMVKLQPHERETCAYLLAYSLYERGDNGSVELLRDFARNYPASPQALAARLAAADYYFFAHRFQEASGAYSELDFARINPADRPLYTYRLALSMLECNRNDEAVPLLKTLVPKKKFNTAARYYLAYTDFAKGDYDHAYPVFKIIASETDHIASGDINPLFYMQQIEYMRGEWDSAARTGERIMGNHPKENIAEDTRRTTGLSLFKLRQYQTARKWLLEYISRCGDTPDSDAVYALGVCDYEAGNHSLARQRFETVADGNSLIAQSANLYLGQIAIEEGDRNTAAISFRKASEMHYDPKVTETALYNYIAARTHGANIPFSSSIPLLRGFLAEYPRSPYAPDAERYLASAYFNEKDFSNALESLRRIPHPSPEVESMKQATLYELGMEAMTSGDTGKAAEYLQEAVTTPGAADIKAQALMWLADALYQNGDYHGAEKNYRQYLRADRNGENNTLAKYNLAYTLLMLEKFSESSSMFADAMKSEPMLPQRLYGDALLRLADTQYYSGNHGIALKNYTMAIENGNPDSDYATFRRAVMYGLDGDINRKISELDAMPRDFPGSKWLPEALLEKGQTLAALGRTSEAVAAFEKLKNTHRQSSQARKGMLNLALAYSKDGNEPRAEETYREIISKWPSSEEASVANDDLRKICAANGSLQEYAAFLNSIPGAPRLTVPEMERLAYEAAENAFANDVHNIALLEKFMENHPDSPFAAQVLLDIATGRDESGMPDEAVAALNRLLQSRPDAPQAPEALLLKAQILEEKGPGSKKEALKAYRLLDETGGNDYAPEAWAGIMRTTDSDQERITYARKTQGAPGLSADQMEEACFFEAVSLLKSPNSKDSEKGIGILRDLSQNPKSLSGAKSAVMLGENLLENGDINGADRTLSAFTDSGTPQQYWLARGFIALADVQHMRGKDYLAKEYLKSLRDNYPGAELDIHDMISSRLKKWK